MVQGRHLHESEVWQIRHLADESGATSQELATIFGVATKVATKVKNRVSYSHIKENPTPDIPKRIQDDLKKIRSEKRDPQSQKKQLERRDKAVADALRKNNEEWELELESNNEEWERELEKNNAEWKKSVKAVNEENAKKANESINEYRKSILKSLNTNFKDEIKGKGFFLKRKREEYQEKIEKVKAVINKKPVMKP